MLPGTDPDRSFKFRSATEAEDERKPTWVVEFKDTEGKFLHSSDFRAWHCQKLDDQTVVMDGQVMEIVGFNVMFDNYDYE